MDTLEILGDVQLMRKAADRHLQTLEHETNTAQACGRIALQRGDAYFSREWAVEWVRDAVQHARKAQAAAEWFTRYYDLS